MSSQPAIHPDLQALIDRGQRTTHQKGVTFIRPDEQKNEIYFLESGLVKAYVVGNHGEEHIHVLFRPGDLFPLVQVITDTRLNMYFSAVAASQVVRIPKSLFQEAIATKAGLAQEVIKLMANQYAVYIARVDNLEYKFARERLAYRLLLLARKIGIASPQGIELPHLSQNEIGSMVNLSRESVSRELNRFERLGIVGYRAGRITITNHAALKRELGADDQMIFLDDPFVGSVGQ